VQSTSSPAPSDTEDDDFDADLEARAQEDISSQQDQDGHPSPHSSSTALQSPSAGVLHEVLLPPSPSALFVGDAIPLVVVASAPITVSNLPNLLLMNASVAHQPTLSVSHPVMGSTAFSSVLKHCQLILPDQRF
jgi:hypothetical protein